MKTSSHPPPNHPLETRFEWFGDAVAGARSVCLMLLIFLLVKFHRVSREWKSEIILCRFSFAIVASSSASAAVAVAEFSIHTCIAASLLINIANCFVQKLLHFEPAVHENNFAGCALSWIRNTTMVSSRYTFRICIYVTKYMSCISGSLSMRALGQLGCIAHTPCGPPLVIAAQT